MFFFLLDYRSEWNDDEKKCVKCDTCVDEQAAVSTIFTSTIYVENKLDTKKKKQTNIII